MRRAAVLVVAVLGCMLAAPAAHAGETVAETSLGSITVSVPDSAWVQNSCLDVPVTATAGTRAGISWTVDLQARLPGSGTGVGTALLGDGSSTVTGVLLMCPTSNGPGTYSVTVTATLRDFAVAGEPGWEQTAVTSTSFTLSRMVSRSTVTSVTRSTRKAVVKGRVTVASAEFGTIGADSQSVRVQYLRSGSWHRLGTAFTDEMGRFTLVAYQPLAAGTRVRVVFARTTVAEGSTSVAVRA